MYRWRPKGNNVIIMPTLGNLLGKKVRFSIENYAWDNSLSANAYIIGQAGTTKEWALFYNNNGRVEVFYGNQANIQLTATRADFFGTANGSVDCDLFEFELDSTTGNWFCRIDGEIRSSGTITLTGSARVDGMEWRLGARAAGDAPAILHSSFFAPANTSFYGDTRVWIDDVLVMHAVIPGGETYVIPDIVRETEGELFASTLPPSDGTDFILIFKPEMSGGGSLGGAADFTFESGSESYFGAGGFRVSGQADYEFSSPAHFSYVSQGGLSVSGVALYSSSVMYLGAGGLSLSGSASEFKTPVKIDQFLIFGASIELQTFQTFSGNVYEVRDDARRVLLNMGSDLPFRNYGVGALTISGLVSNLPGYLANHPNTDGISAMVHIGGNDNSSNGAWSNWTEQQKIDFHDGLESICQMITSAGIDLILCPLTYRLNTDPAQLNENIIYPLIQQYSPDWWDPVAQKPLLDLYQISYDAGPEYFRDNVHTTHPYGTNVLQEGVFGALNTNADLPPWSGKKTISVNFCGDAERPAGTNNVLTQNATLSVVKDILGDAVDGAIISFSGYTSLSGIPFPGTSHLIASDSLNYNAIARYTGTTSSSPCVISIELGEEYAGRSGVIKITGARYSGSPSGNRWSVFEIDGASSEIDAEAIPPEQITLPLTMDENGACIVNHTVRAGGQFGYLSAFDLILDEPAGAFEFVGSGGLAIAGQGAVSSAAGYLGEGGLSVSGSALISISRGFAYTGAGGLDAGGIAQISTASAYAAAGGVSVSGTAPYSFSEVGRYEYTGSGGVLFSGQADLSFNMPSNFEAFGSGGLAVGGSATTRFTGAGICIKMGIIVSAAKMGVIIRG